MWEKAGVGVSVVYGTMPPEAYRAAKGNNHNSKPTSNGVRPLSVLIWKQSQLQLHLHLELIRSICVRVMCRPLDARPDQVGPHCTHPCRALA